MSAPVRAGIVGTGFMADVHTHAIRAAGGVMAEGDVHTALGDSQPEGLPGSADGLRAAVLTHAVLDSAARQAWVDVAP